MVTAVPVTGPFDNFDKKCLKEKLFMHARAMFIVGSGNKLRTEYILGNMLC